MRTLLRSAVYGVMGCVVSILMTAAWANSDDELTDFKPAVRPNGNGAGAPSRSAPCAIEGLPSEFDVYAAGAYGGRPLSLQIDQSGHEATQFDVAVNAPGQTVVLMLGAYEPSVWSIGWTAGTRIAAVWVSGYHRQAVIGLPKGTAILNSSYEDRQRTACPYFYFSSSAELASANALAKSVLHKPIKMFYPKPADATPIYIGAPIAPGTRIVTSTHTKLEDITDKSAPLAGPAGVQDAVHKGLLRKATAADFEAYLQVRERNTPKPDLPPIAGDDGQRKPVRYFDGFVVLKPFTFPAGLYGGNSTNFIIAQGVPMPSGNPGHSAVYDMNTGRCTGAVCESR